MWHGAPAIGRWYALPFVYELDVMYYLAVGINTVATMVILVKLGFKVYEYYSDPSH